MTGLRRALVGLGIAGVVAGVVPLLLALSAPDDINDPALTAVFGPLVGWSFIGTGLFAWYRRPDNKFGALMAAVGFTWCVSGLAVDRNSYVFIVGYIFASLPFALLFHMLSAFPTGRLDGTFARSVAALGYFATTVLWWAILLFYDTTRDDWASNPLMAFDDQGTADTLLAIQSVLALGLTIAVPFVLRQRWLSAGRPMRQVLAPVYITASVLMVLLLITLIADLSGLSDEVEVVIDVAGLVTLVLIPFAFLGGLLRSRLSRAGAVSELVARLTERDDRRSGLRDALADALGDPGLSLLYWLPSRERYVNAEGQPVELPAPFGDRVATVVEDHGTPVAAIVHDSSLHDERDLIAAVGAAATLTLENERLDAELRAKVEELRDQRRRGVVAALDERRRLERNLHDGAQQRLVAMALKLRMARTRVAESDPETEKLLASAASELNSALEELRELARGIHPAVLSDRGLDAALEALAHRSPIPVELEATPGVRLPEAVETAAYFVVAEALTNVAKYASATRATVRAVRDNGHVVVEVTDDGVGGADPVEGIGPGGPGGPALHPGRPPRGDGRARRRHDRAGGHPVLGDGHLRVVVADDSVLLREGIVRLLDEQDGFEVVAQAGDAEELLRKVGAHKPDVAVVDIRMPPTNTDDGLRAALEIRARQPETSVLVLSQYVEEGYALDLVGDTAGGVGYLLKDRVADVDRFVDAVRRVAEGGSALDPEVVAQLVGRARRNDPLEALTPREREVLELMAEGRSNHAIADQMVVTERAVEKHVTSIFGKLGLPPAPEDHRRVLAVLTFLRT